MQRGDLYLSGVSVNSKNDDEGFKLLRVAGCGLRVWIHREIFEIKV